MGLQFIISVIQTTSHLPFGYILFK
jgi:hypothetical protein